MAFLLFNRYPGEKWKKDNYPWGGSDTLTPDTPAPEPGRYLWNPLQAEEKGDIRNCL